MTCVIRLAPDASEADQHEVVRLVRQQGAEPRVHNAATLSVAGDSWDGSSLSEHRAVVEVADLAQDVPLTAATPGRRSEPRKVGAVGFSRDEFVVIAGPCSVETREQMLSIALGVQEAGANMLRGGLFKPRSSPYSFQGLRESGFDIAHEAKAKTGLPFVTEVLDPRDVTSLTEVADVLQIGARNMQNFELLREAGASGVPVVLKRGIGNTVSEFLQSAEYILAAGCTELVLCERGIRTFENSYRFTLDLGAIPIIQEKTHLPVIVDPSHAAGQSRWVGPLALAAAAAGADGLIIETHVAPEKAWCDAAQAYPTADLPDLMTRLRFAASAAGRTLTGSPTAAPQPLLARIA